MAERDGFGRALHASLVHVFSRLGLGPVLKDFEPELVFDKVHGIDTRQEVELDGLGLGDNLVTHAVEYDPTPAHEFASALKRLKIDHRDYAFIDYGSGKGKVLFLAAEFPFQSVQGVEASPGLHDVASLNISKFPTRVLACANIKSICTDAAEFVPDETPTVAYFYNPFDDVVLSRVLSKLDTSLRHCRLPSYLIYKNPVHHQTVLQSDKFVFVESLFGGRIFIYRYEPEVGAP